MAALLNDNKLLVSISIPACKTPSTKHKSDVTSGSSNADIAPPKKKPGAGMESQLGRRIWQCSDSPKPSKKKLGPKPKLKVATSIARKKRYLLTKKVYSSGLESLEVRPDTSGSSTGSLVAAIDLNANTGYPWKANGESP
ncbi:hypothetical protein K438DRAFT_1774041 [Mycena galopus ATCC 62051]|nr:hypothetical protein K438DRAFT_1774041 [Mycena galopus ATCC 62051]